MRAELLMEVSRLQEALTSPPQHEEASSLRDQVTNAYIAKTLEKLRILLTPEVADEALSQTLKQFLAENWSLINGTCVCYTALPTHKLTQLCVKIAKQIGNATTLPINLLMPTIYTSDFQTSTKDLTHQDLNTVLKTHALGATGRYLIPLDVLATLEMDINLTKVFNRYDDSEDVSEHEYLSPQELQQLAMYSPLAEAVLNLKKQYDHLANDHSNLLGHLNELVRLLVYNSTQGIGSEEIAGKGGMIAVLVFFEYYDRLTDAQRNTIPDRLQKELQLLRDYSVPEAERFKKGLPSIGSCLATRSAELKRVIAGNEPQLASIGLSDTDTRALMQAVMDKFANAKVDLSHDLTGQDTLGVTKGLLQALEINFILHGYKDLPLLTQLSATEMSDLCTLPVSSLSIIMAIQNIENLVILLHELSPEKINALLTAMGPDLRAVYVTSCKKLSCILMSLESEKFEMVFETMKNGSPSLIKSTADLNDLLQNLSEAQRSVVLQTMKDSLPSLIKSTADLIKVSHYLSDEQRGVLYEAMTENSLNDLSSIKELKLGVRELSPRDCALVFQIIKKRIPQIIQSGEDIGEVLKDLSSEQVKAILETMKESLPNIIKTHLCFSKALLYLHPAQSMEFLSAMKEQLPTLIQSAQDVQFYLGNFSTEKKFSPQQQAIAFEAINNIIPNLIQSSVIQSTQDVRELFDALRLNNGKKRQIYFDVVKERLPSIIKSTKDIEFWLSTFYIPGETSIDVFNVIKEQIPSCIQSMEEFESVEGLLDNEESTDQYFELMKARLPVICSSDELNSIYEQRLINQFYLQYEKLNQPTNRGFFSPSTIPNYPRVDLSKILDDAKNNNNRCRAVCVGLGWMTGDGLIKKNAPQMIISTDALGQANHSGPQNLDGGAK